MNKRRFIKNIMGEQMVVIVIDNGFVGSMIVHRYLDSWWMCIFVCRQPSLPLGPK